VATDYVNKEKIKQPFSTYLSLDLGGRITMALRKEALKCKRNCKKVDHIILESTRNTIIELENPEEEKGISHFCMVQK
jgi:hypothetical protein